MNEGSSDNGNPASEENGFSLTRRQIVTLVTAPLLAILVYWLTLPQGELVADLPVSLCS